MVNKALIYSVDGDAGQFAVGKVSYSLSRISNS